MALEFAARLCMIVHTPEVVSVRHGCHRAIEREDFESVARQIEVTDDFRAQERNDVRKNGELEAGNDFLCDGGAAEEVAPSEDKDLLARAPQIGGVDKAVVTAADNDDVVLLGHEEYFCDARTICGHAARAGAFYKAARDLTTTRSLPVLPGCDGRSILAGRYVGDWGKRRSDCASRNCRSREDLSVVRESELPRMVGVLRGKRV